MQSSGRGLGVRACLDGLLLLKVGVLPLGSASFSGLGGIGKNLCSGEEEDKDDALPSIFGVYWLFCPGEGALSLLVKTPNGGLGLLKDEGDLLFGSMLVLLSVLFPGSPVSSDFVVSDNSPCSGGLQSLSLESSNPSSPSLNPCALW